MKTKPSKPESRKNSFERYLETHSSSELFFLNQDCGFIISFSRKKFFFIIQKPATLINPRDRSKLIIFCQHGILREQNRPTRITNYLLSLSLSLSGSQDTQLLKSSQKLGLCWVRVKKVGEKKKRSTMKSRLDVDLEFLEQELGLSLWVAPWHKFPKPCQTAHCLSPSPFLRRKKKTMLLKPIIIMRIKMRILIII